MWKLSLTAGMVLLALQTSAVAGSAVVDAFPPRSGANLAYRR
jgi:hypothetical protein